MAKAFDEVAASGDAAALPHLDWLALLRDREMTYRHDRKLTASFDMRGFAPSGCRRCRLPCHARSRPRAISRSSPRARWIDAHDNVILSGPTGVGQKFAGPAL